MGAHYRLLAVGERRMKEDETFDPITEGWHMMQEIGIGMPVKAGDNPVRRPFTPVGRIATWKANWPQLETTEVEA